MFLVLSKHNSTCFFLCHAAGPSWQNQGYSDRQGNPTYVDAFGDVVMSTTLCHDTWKTCHNDVQRALEAKAYTAPIKVDAEVLGLFEDQIPEPALKQGKAWRPADKEMAASQTWG